LFQYPIVFDFPDWVRTQMEGSIREIVSFRECVVGYYDLARIVLARDTSGRSRAFFGNLVGTLRRRRRHEKS
jgi:hypothetical protein